MIRQQFKIAKEFLLDLFFPRFCVGCGLEGKWICDSCEKKIVTVATQVCPDCNRISEHGRYCVKCRKKHKLSGIMVAAYYEEGPIKEAIHNFKYNNVTELAGFLSDLLAKSLQGQKPKLGKDIILTAVPMHFLKKAQRGYNQAEMLADVVAEQISAQGGPASGWKLQKSYQIIKKIRKTKSQVSKSGKKRRENLKNSFKIIDKNIINNRNIIIVDDVTTTGTTLEECARVLKSAGAKKVWGLVVARG